MHSSSAALPNATDARSLNLNSEPSVARREVLLVADSAELAEQMKAQLLSPSSSQAVGKCGGVHV
jgi:hypothetical protein